MKALKHFLKTFHCITVIIFIIIITFIIGNVTDRETFSDGTAIASLAENTILEISSPHYLVTAPGIIKEPINNLPSPPPISLIEITGRIKSGDTMSTSLRRCAINDDVREQIIQSFKTILDFKRLRPGDHYIISLDADGKLVQCIYEAGPLDVYSLQRTDQGFQARQNDIPVVRKTMKLSGTISTSLFAAFYDHHEDSKLIYAFADIFASRIDFNTEAQVGDSFEVVFEKYFKNDEFIGYGNILYASYSQSKQNSTQEAIYFSSDTSSGAYFDREGKELGASFVRSPVPLGRISSRFTFRRKHPISGRIVPHLGVDFAAPHGTPVMAAADGKVKFIGTNGGFGKQIVLSHGGDYQTHYGHLSRFKKGLRKGRQVKKKEVIGYIGATGLATGPHLDYRVQHHGVFINPFSMKYRPKSILQGAELAKLLETADDVTAMIHSSENNNIIAMKNILLSPKNIPISLL